jgi:hypothetical protein
VKFEGLLGYFLERVFSAFDSNMISTDDYDQTARPGWNRFNELRVQVIAYRRKLDKFVIFTLILFVEIYLHFLWKKLNRMVTQFLQSKKIESTNPDLFDTEKDKLSRQKMKKTGLRIRSLDNISFVVTLLSVLDIMFYSGHQLIHQRPSTIFGSGNFDWTLSYLWSLSLLFFIIYLFIRNMRRVVSLSNVELNEHMDLHNILSGNSGMVSRIRKADSGKKLDIFELEGDGEEEKEPEILKEDRIKKRRKIKSSRNKNFVKINSITVGGKHFLDKQMRKSSTHTIESKSKGQKKKLKKQGKRSGVKKSQNSKKYKKIIQKHENKGEKTKSPSQLTKNKNTKK